MIMASYLAVNTKVPWIGTGCHEGMNTPRFDGASFHASMLQQLPAVMCATHKTINPPQARYSQV